MLKHSVVAAILVSAGCGAAKSPDADLPFPLAGPDAAPDPSTFGPLPVGVRTMSLVDTSRMNIMTGMPQVVTTEVWYPAAASARGQAGKGYDIRTEFTAAEVEQVNGAGIAVPLLQTAAVEDAPPDTTHGPYPLIIFSHGMCGMRWQSTYYTVPLASHGYIVAAPDHEGDTLGDCIADEVATGNYPSTVYFFTSRPLDVMYLISFFEQQLTGQPNLPTTDPLNGLVDPVQIGVSGHSYGAYTSLNVAAQDPRVKAIVPQAPTSSGIDFLGYPDGYILSTPTMIQGGGDDHTLPYETNTVSAFDAVANPKYMMELVHGGHFTFSDLCQFNLTSIAPLIGFVNLTNVIDDGCGPPPVPQAAVAQPMINNFAIGFFNMTLRGSTRSQGYLTQERADNLAAGVALITYDEP